MFEIDLFDYANFLINNMINNKFETFWKFLYLMKAIFSLFVFLAFLTCNEAIFISL